VYIGASDIAEYFQARTDGKEPNGNE
jgi:hypothetical protein